MHVRNRITTVGAATAVLVLVGATCAQGHSADRQRNPHADKPITVSSKAFDQGETVPTKFTCDGVDVSPALHWRHIPKKAEALALVVDDPDAPGGTWTHWVVLDIPRTTRVSHEDGVPKGGVQAENSWGDASYGGPCPPSGTHRYRFKLYALDEPTGLDEGASLETALDAVAEHATEHGQLVGLYSAK